MPDRRVGIQQMFCALYGATNPDGVLGRNGAKCPPEGAVGHCPARFALVSGQKKTGAGFHHVSSRAKGWLAFAGVRLPKVQPALRRSCESRGLDPLGAPMESRPRIRSGAARCGLGRWVRAAAVGWLLLICRGGAATAQGFAGLGADATGFAVPQPGLVLEFPRDHGAHPDYRIEWWYLTANLQGPDGTDYGIQWTLFRTALAPFEVKGWASPQVWLGHAALTTPMHHYVAERLARGGIGQAGVVAEPFAAWIDEWQMTGLEQMALSAGGVDFAYDLALRATGPLVLQGQQGYSVKSREGQASAYYSQPFYQVTGSLTLPEGQVNVTGQGWLDREWSSQPLATDQTGWDWFSLHFDSGEKLMAFRLRDSGAGYTAATWISAEGVPEPLPDGALVLEPGDVTDVAGHQVPTTWRLQLGAKGVDITTVPLNPQAWMATSFPYWEGPIRFSGSHAGRGYLEMTGYE